MIEPISSDNQRMYTEPTKALINMDPIVQLSSVNKRVVEINSDVMKLTNDTFETVPISSKIDDVTEKLSVVKQEIDELKNKFNDERQTKDKEIERLKKQNLELETEKKKTTLLY